jgi:hypothetical protein
MWMVIFLGGIMQNMKFGKVSRHFLTIIDNPFLI